VYVFCVVPGIKHLHIAGELFGAAKAAYECKSALVLTGFPVFLDRAVPAETDGPPGAIAIARALHALGKHVRLVADDSSFGVVAAGIKSCGLQQQIPLELIPVTLRQKSLGEQQAYMRKLLNISDSETTPDVESDAGTADVAVDLVVSLELSGPGKDGSFYSMRGVDLTHLCGPYEILYEIAQQEAKCCTIGIGDGGNEVGMGKVFDAVVKHIMNGPKVACTITADHCITAGVSNWGGWAIAVALCAMHRENSRDSNAPVDLDSFVSTAKHEAIVVKAINEAGASDGMTGEKDMRVDGLEHSLHMKMLQDLRALLN
jgi:D-glutamate cyclase